MGVKLETPAGKIHIEARRIVALKKVLGNLSYSEWRDWNTFGKDNVAKWMAIAFGFIMIKTRTHKTKTRMLFMRTVKLNSQKKETIDQLGVKVMEHFIKKKEQAIKTVEIKDYSEEDYADKVFEAQ